jgi:hypothetical protein
MTADREVTRIVRSWLGTDEHEHADRVLETVLSRLDTTPQRRLLWPSRRFAQMNNVTRVAIAAAAVLVLAVIGYNLLPRSGGVGGQPTPAPTATPAETPTPTPTYPALNGQATLAGRYTVGELQSQVTVQVPAGWSTDTDWVVIGPKGNAAPAGMAVRFYTVANAFKNPRSINDGVFDPPVGPTAADLASAIVGDPAWAATQTADVTIDDRQAKHVQFTVPASSGLGSDGRFLMFGIADQPDTWGFALGQVFDLYIVDVGAERVVIDAFHYPGTSATDLAAQQAVIASIQFNPAQQGTTPSP